MPDNFVPLAVESQLLASLRDSDFDSFSAYGEVVDNSIQAGAKHCRIQTKTTSSRGPGRPYLKIVEMAFGDDGCGMDVETLHRCLSLGWSSRFNDRQGIGRFGVGMTLGAVHEARRIEVFSKREGGTWHFVHLDIDDFIGSNPIGIAAPIAKNPPPEYHRLVDDSSGTLVIWKKYDRQPKSYDNMAGEISDWLGRTFRYFIWNGLELELDGQLVLAHDPLYLRTDKTRFPRDPTAVQLQDIVIDWDVEGEDRGAAGVGNSKITIKMSLLPQAWRERQGDGGSETAKQRRIPENEGISILRNEREVFYDHIPHFKVKFEEIDRWWGCEIHFSPALDRAFTVKNIKRGAVPNVILKETIAQKIQGTIKDCRQRVREVWNVARATTNAEAGSIPTDHTVGEGVARDTPLVKGKLDSGKNLEDETKKAIDTFFSDKEDQYKAKLREIFKSQPFTIQDGQWNGPHFVEVSHLGGRALLTYNQRHPFNYDLSRRMDVIESGTTNGINDAKWLRACIDILMIAYAKAESLIDPNEVAPPEQVLETLRLNWGQFLKAYVETWNKQNEQ